MRIRRARPALLGILVAVAVLLGLAPGAGAAEADRTSRAERVVVISIPTLTWEQVADHEPPALVSLLSRSAVASMSVRTFGADTTMGEAYATIGAGNRAAVIETVAGLAFPPDEEVNGEPAGVVLERRSGEPIGDAAAVHLGAPAIVRLNDRLLYDAEPGALGAALAGAGATGAVIANADLELDLELDVELLDARRHGALALMDRQGAVAAGSVGPELRTGDPTAPLGLHLDREAVLDAFDDVAGAEVVLVELSDLYRADAFDLLAGRDAARRARVEALAVTDEIVAGLLERIDLDRELVVLVAPVAPGGPAQLTVAAIAGPEVEPGSAQSGSTRRPGYVTLPDVAPTALRWLGIDQPAAMNGAAMTGAEAFAPGSETWDDRALDNRLALFRNEVTGPLSVLFIAVLVVALALAAAALTWRRQALRRAAAQLLLTCLAVPLVTFLSGPVREDLLGVPGAIAATFAAAALIGFGAHVVGRRLRRPGRSSARSTLHAALVPPLLILVPTALLLFLDIAIGGPLQINTAFGYGGGAIVAGRFSGYGNLAWGLLAVAVITATTGLWGRWQLSRPTTRSERRWALVAMALVYVALMLAVGLPTLGQNVGGTLSVVPGSIIVVSLLAGVRLDLRRLFLVGLATLGVLAAFGVADLARPAEDRTHLGRLIASTFGDGGLEALGTVLQRKVNANLSILTSSIWSVVIPVAIAFIAFLVWRPPRFMQVLLDELPGMRACLVGTVATGVLAAILNDSGIAIPAIMLTLLTPYVGYLVLQAVAQEPVGPAGQPSP